MSLENPMWYEKVFSVLKLKWVYIPLALILVLVFSWGALHSFQNYRARKNLEALKANVNTALQNVANAQSKVEADKPDESRAVQEFKDATNQYLEAANATEQARIETNRAIANVQRAVNANKDVNASADDVLKTLDRLNQ